MAAKGLSQHGYKIFFTLLTLPWRRFIFTIVLILEEHFNNKVGEQFFFLKSLT